MMINRARGHAPGNYHIRHDIRTRNASVEQQRDCETLGLGPLQSMSGRSCRKLSLGSCQLSPTQSQLAALAVDRVQCASCKSRGAGSRPAGPILRPPRPGPQKRFLGFYNVMADFTAMKHGPRATNATLDQILCFMEANFCTHSSSVTF